MLKWLVLAVVIVAAGLYGLRKYSLEHATQEGSFSAKLYERRIEGQLLDHCRAFVKEHPQGNEENMPQQYEAFCKCYANDLFDKFRNVPPGELDEAIQQAEYSTTTQSIVKRCFYQSGLN